MDAMQATPTEEVTLRPFVRLRQITTEIRSAIQNEDLELTVQAARLLAPAVEACHAIDTESAAENREIVQFSRETYLLLQQCEQELEAAMQRTLQEIARLRQGRGRLRVLRQEVGTEQGARLDAFR